MQHVQGSSNSYLHHHDINSSSIMHINAIILKLGLAAAAVLTVASAAPQQQHDYVGADYHGGATSPGGLTHGSGSSLSHGSTPGKGGSNSQVGPALQGRDAGVSTSSNKALQKTITNGHNSPRNRYHAPQLTWNSTLASYAQNWVDRCQFAHSGGPYGENLYAVMPKPSNAWDDATQDALAAWMGEASKYDFSNPGFSMDTGHFTQFVWKNTQQVGCAWNTANCKGMTIFMCNYYPPGNVGGQYQQNVLKP